MNSPRLGVNIDHVATIRNARGEKYPSPLKAALLAKKFGADSITIHLREDRRHINDQDLIFIKKNLKIPLNLEMAPTKEMLKISLKYKPNFVCIVPEKRKEITTEGGLNLKYNLILIKKIIKNKNINQLKIILANECTKMLHGNNEAKLAEETAKKTFEENSTGSGLPTISINQKKLSEKINIIDLVVLSKLENSKSEIRRLIKGNGIKINNQVINDEKFSITKELFSENFIKLSIGKKRHIKVKLN